MNPSSLEKAYTSPSLKSEYHLNNQYRNFPPLMNDGRSVISSWQPGAVVNESILQKNEIKNNWEYRKYLTKNADSIRKDMFEQSINDIGYSIRNENTHVNQQFSAPSVYGSFTDPIRHRFAESSDIKDTYLSREQLEAKRLVPALTQDELLKMNRQ